MGIHRPYIMGRRITMDRTMDRTTDRDSSSTSNHASAGDIDSVQVIDFARFHMISRDFTRCGKKNFRGPLEDGGRKARSRRETAGWPRNAREPGIRAPRKSLIIDDYRQLSMNLDVSGKKFMPSVTGETKATAGALKADYPTAVG